MPFLRVYFASKTSHAQKWRDYDLHSPVLKVTARWIKQVLLDGECVITNPKLDKNLRDFAARCWIEDQQDVQCSDYLVLYAEEGEHLRGGLVETGIAIEYGIPVICIGSHPDYGSWQWHPMCLRLDSLEHLEAWAKRELDRRISNMKQSYLQG